jgi:hypothetical protein
MAADLADARRWTRDGTTQLIGETAGLGEAALSAPKLTTAGGDPAPALGPWL